MNRVEKLKLKINKYVHMNFPMVTATEPNIFVKNVLYIGILVLRQITSNIVYKYTSETTFLKFEY